MILGVGNDVVNIDRIGHVLDRHGDRFRNRVFTEQEQELARRMADGIGILAKRWAAKEACSKALGTGLTAGVALRDIEIRTRRGHPPALLLHGGARRRLEALLPDGHHPCLHLSMSDDWPVATATVIIEAVPAQANPS